GYASLLYGLELGARSVLAFAASTDLSPVRKRLEEAVPPALLPVPPHALQDLRALYPAAPDPPRARLVFGERNQADAAATRPPAPPPPPPPPPRPARRRPSRPPPPRNRLPAGAGRRNPERRASSPGRARNPR